MDRVFHSFRTETRDALLADVRASFARMTEDEFGQFLAGLPTDQHRQQARSIRAKALN